MTVLNGYLQMVTVQVGPQVNGYVVLVTVQVGPQVNGYRNR
jgi:multidrug resistance efflux pump